MKESNIEEWRALLASQPELGYRMILIRMMMEQRGITARGDLAPELDASAEAISKVLRPNFIRPDGVPYHLNTISVSSATKWLDRIEEGITAITDRRGGLKTTDISQDLTRIKEGWEMHDGEL